MNFFEYSYFKNWRHLFKVPFALYKIYILDWRRICFSRKSFMKLLRDLFCWVRLWQKFYIMLLCEYCIEFLVFANGWLVNYCLLFYFVLESFTIINYCTVFCHLHFIIVWKIFYWIPASNLQKSFLIITDIYLSFQFIQDYTKLLVTICYHCFSLNFLDADMGQTLHVVWLNSMQQVLFAWT